MEKFSFWHWYGGKEHSVIRLNLGATLYFIFLLLKQLKSDYHNVSNFPNFMGSRF